MRQYNNEPVVADDLTLRTVVKRGPSTSRAAKAKHLSIYWKNNIGETLKLWVNITRYKEGLKIQCMGFEDLDIHYSQIESIHYIQGNSYKVERSPVLRAVAGNFIADGPGMIAGAISGLPDKKINSILVGLSFWDPVRRGWRELVFEDFNDDAGTCFLRLAAQDLMAYENDIDPDTLPWETYWQKTWIVYFWIFIVMSWPVVMWNINGTQPYQKIANILYGLAIIGAFVANQLLNERHEAKTPLERL